MTYKPTRELRFCVFGNELHEAAPVPQGGWLYDPMRCVVEVEGLQLQRLFKVWAARVPGVRQSYSTERKLNLKQRKLHELGSCGYA
jgi:hypothetical protein